MTSRRIAFNILNSVINEGAYLHLALKEGLRGCDSNSAAFITALTHAAIENLKYSDYLLAHFVKGRMHGSIRLILRMGIAELLMMNTAPYAVINESVKLTKEIGKSGLAGFVNGVLRRIDRERDSLPALPDDDSEYLQVKFGIPRFLADEYLSQYGREFTEKRLASANTNMTFRAQYPYTSDEVIARLNAVSEYSDITFEFGKLDPNAIIPSRGFDATATRLFKDGMLTVQSESAMLVCRACKVRPGIKVLDACAAPGGKTAYLASLMRNTGFIQAWELHENRVKLTNATLSRLGANAACIRHDATEPMPELYENFDIVLIDAPCTGFGVSSKPDTYLNRTESTVREICCTQKKILDECCKYVKSGGALVYATCTISRPENEENVLGFLAEHKEFELEGFSDMLPVEYADRASGGMLQLFPHLDGSDGFFIARMIKKD